MALTDRDQIKFNLQESRFPYFTDAEIDSLLEQFGSVKAASYQGCLIKAQDDSVKLGPINTVSNQSYWLRRARQFNENATGVVQRADE